MSTISKILIASALVFTNVAYAASPAVANQASDTGALTQRVPTKSIKKARADMVHLTPPQVLEEGDNSFGLRANQGGIYNGSPLMGFNFERMVKPNFGVGVIVGYSNFTNKMEAGPIKVEMENTVWTTILAGSFHADVLKVKNLDTYLTVGFGHAFINTEVKTKGADFDSSAFGDVKSDAAANFFIGYVNARYFIDSSWAFTASIGTGQGLLGIGMDYLF